MGIVNLNVHIRSAQGVGGKYPFVVVCFDNDIKSELFKTEAVEGGTFASWDHLHAIDFSAEMKNITDSGKPEPSYLTFFIFDTGAPGVPSLGSAGVLLKTVQENRMSQGEFPIIGGARGATLNLSVTYEKVKSGEEGFLSSNTAKVGAGVGAAALATGLAALAFNQHKKKKKGDAAPKKKKKKKSKWGFGSKSGEGEGTRSIGEEGEEGEEEDEEDEEEEEGQTRSRPWWDPTTSSSETGDNEGDGNEEEGGEEEEEEEEEEGGEE